MHHLAEMCCDQCRAQLEAIELRATQAPTPTTMAEAFDDRRELLMMVEKLLRTVAGTRIALYQAHTLLTKAIGPLT